MKTAMLVAIFAIGGAVAFAGLAAAAGTNAIVLGTSDGSGSGGGMMDRNGGCHGSGGQSAQYQYRYDGECPGCQAELNNNYSWSYGEGAANQCQGECSGDCGNYYNWDHSWCWNNSYCGQ